VHNLLTGSLLHPDREGSSRSMAKKTSLKAMVHHH
jgi:hypothetical protein